MPENATEVTAAGIARLAGVGRAAVSNWRRRHADFPQPVGGTETSPSFALPEVERWLRDQGKLAEVPLRERVWQQLSGHPSGAVTALVHTGCALLLVDRSPAAWREITGVSDDRMAGVLSLALDDALADRFGPAGNGRAVRTPDRDELLPSVPLLRGAAELAAESGTRDTYEFLLGRQLDANPRQYTLTPPGLAELMAELAGTGEPGVRTVLDPAAGTGALLAAAPGPAGLYGQESDPGLAAVTALRLALRTAPADCAVDVRTGDTLRTDAFPDLAADAVLCHPPFNERNWGHDELAYDPRWEYGFPARTESELAWVQHALARLREGGTAVLLMPPAAASRRSGRRIRADLLRRGALRAVIALPAGAAPPYGIPLHLWVLRRPGAEPHPTPELLLVDTAEPAEQTTGGGRDRLDLTALRHAVLDAWHAYDAPGGKPGSGRRETATGAASRTVPVIELLDDDVDLAPARHLPSPAATGGPAELAGVRERLTRTLGLATGLTPPPPALTTPAHRPLTTIGELARAGALQLRHGGTGTGNGPVLTEHDVLAGTAPTGSLPADQTPEEPVLVAAGDVVVPVLGGVTVVRVVDEATAGAALGRNLQLLRPDPDVLDPWFLAGFLRGTTNNRQASSHASTATRLDARRLQLPRLPLAEQRRYGERFRALAAFEDALRLAGRLGGQLVQGLYDGLTDGTVTPE
ncbi:type I restriction-modification system DNA methylase subunit [Streptomyces sp. KhCrAH-43]|uniref:N-6 DNA methylase n=1 Tax=unclassified Streptomyces TaxID=2593676 RepID=UPI000360C2DC|nr:N-6 DNA methylase [Streptomyces sp. KhCrAH-43]MYS36050.1 N-6 DNA methylase [Streptomyces sp. SID4920]MYX70679.1 N-6 DNA methylase [Streptomyces sp. SID8373]RAJ55828.1 type I restriction-modification system DNA methylase subunit [Streptomyces sp. KhCrAH-43]